MADCHHWYWNLDYTSACLALIVPSQRGIALFQWTPASSRDEAILETNFSAEENLETLHLRLEWSVQLLPTWDHVAVKNRELEQPARAEDHDSAAWVWTDRKNQLEIEERAEQGLDVEKLELLVKRLEV